MQRRQLAAFGGAAVALAACANLGKGSKPVTLDQVKSAVNTLISEMPTARQSLAQSGASAATLAAFDQAVTSLKAANVSLQASTVGENVTQLITTIGQALSAILASIPQTSAFAPIVGIVVVLVTSFLSGQQVVAKMPAPVEVHAAAAAPFRFSK